MSENKLWQQLDKLRGRWHLEEVRNTILNTIENRDNPELNKDIVFQLDLLSKDEEELINLFYSLKVTNYENIFFFNDSIENLALEIFKEKSKSNSKTISLFNSGLSLFSIVPRIVFRTSSKCHRPLSFSSCFHCLFSDIKSSPG